MKSTWKTAAIIAAILIPAFSFGITANALSFAGTQHSFVFEVSAETLVYGDFEYTLVGDDVTLTKFIGENDTYSIPAEIDGHTVTTIGEDCFKNSGVITATIPDSVTKIEKQAFYNCTALKTVVLPNELNTLGQEAFMNCTSLETINIPATLVNIGYNEYFSGYAPFANCSALKAVTFGDGITKIPTHLFESCTGLSEITVPDTVD
ncbi:MAG: leucine-rich repeat domain-containing protein, partial [Clostridia bacterium]|nr:leucine-rich repeat domain-containing protein [Clostridia bacterium]